MFSIKPEYACVKSKLEKLRGYEVALEMLNEFDLLHLSTFSIFMIYTLPSQTNFIHHIF